MKKENEILSTSEEIYQFLKNNENFAEYINNTYAHKVKTSEETVSLMFQSDVYAKYLAHTRKLKSTEKTQFLKDCIARLNDFDDPFWLDSPIDAFYKFLQEIKEDNISLEDIRYYMPDTKLMVGFTEYYRTRVESVNTPKRRRHYKNLEKRYKELDKIIINLLSQQFTFEK